MPASQKHADRFFSILLGLLAGILISVAILAAKQLNTGDDPSVQPSPAASATSFSKSLTAPSWALKGTARAFYLAPDWALIDDSGMGR